MMYWRTYNIVMQKHLLAVNGGFVIHEMEGGILEEGLRLRRDRRKKIMGALQRGLNLDVL